MSPKEASTGEINLEEDDADIVEIMLQFLYKGDYLDGRFFPKSAGVSSQPASEGQPSRAKPLFDFGSTPLNTSSFVAAAKSTVFPVPRAPGIVAAARSTGSSIQRAPDIPPSDLGNLGQSDSTTPLSNPFAKLATTISDFPFRAEALITNAKVYIIAEQYDIEPLKYLARTKYADILPSTWNTPSFVESLQFIYDGTPDLEKTDQLRGIVISYAGEHVKELMDRVDFVALCKERGDIATDVMKAAFHKSTTIPKSSPTHLKFSVKQCKIDSKHDIEVVSQVFGPSLYKCVACGTFVS